jgi:drug/metabolite transporter (DMT)-like permease
LRVTAGSNRRGFLLVTAAAIGWSSGGLFSRALSLDNWTMAAWRGVFGALGLSLVLLISRRENLWEGTRRLGWRGWLFVLQAALGMMFYLAALRHTTVASVAVIYATTPLLAGILSYMALRERPRPSAVLGTLLALLGVGVMVGFAPRGDLTGDLLALGMALSMAVTTVVARNVPEIPVLLTACLASLLSGLLSWPFGTPWQVSGHELALLAAFGFINFAIALPLFTRGAQLLPAIETTLIGALESPLAPLWVWIGYAETPSAGTIGGGLLVFAAVAMHLVAVSRSPQPSAAGS